MSMPQDQIDLMNRMVEEINSAPILFGLSEFWLLLNRRNMEQLHEHGVENFKRTVNQNYFNWMPTALSDRRYRRMLQFYSENPPPTPWKVEYEGVEVFEDLKRKNPLEEEVLLQFYADLVGLIWYYTLKTDKHDILSSLSEPEIGNPIRIVLDGKLISQDVANSVRERNVVADHMGDAKVVAELGPGYGRVAYIFALTTRCRYLLFDIPPALYVAQWYLGQLFPDRRHFTFRHFDRFEEIAEELEASDLAFFTPNQLALFPAKYVDAFITISSLQEMLPAQVENFLRLMSHTTKGIIYLKQYAKWRNPVDKVVTRCDAYRIAGWERLVNRRDDVQPRLCEMVYQAPGNAEITAKT